MSNAGQDNFNPANAKAKEIADKLARARQRVAAQKNATQGSVFAQYVSSLSIGLKMPLNELLNLTIYQLYDLIERYNLFTN